MKIISYFIILILCFLHTSCKQPTQPIPTDMYVSFEVESDFQDDSVEVILDDTTLMQSRVTTNYTVDLAWSSGLQKLSRNNHILRFVVIEYGVQKDYKIDVTNDTSTVLMDFNKDTKEIDIRQYKGRFLRD
jgi:hypothetical protein